MKLSALRALVAAIEEGSLRGAARRLGVSQPSLTKVMRELEQQLGAPLLQRTRTGVAPTMQGKVLYTRSLAAMRELDEATQHISQLGGRMVGRLSVVAVPLAVVLLVPETVRTFSRAFPDIQMHVREELYIGQLAALRQHEVDVALGPVPDNLPTGEFHVEPLIPIEMVVVVRRGHPLAQARRLADLADARWVYTSVTGSTGYARVLHERCGLPPPAPAAVVNSTLGLLSLVAHGDFVGLMPLPLVQHPAAAPFLQVLSLQEGPLMLELAAILHVDGLLRPAVKQFMAHVHRAAHQLRPPRG